MSDKFTVEAELTDDGKLILHLPSQLTLTHKDFTVTIEASDKIKHEEDEELEEVLNDDSLEGQGLPMGKIELPEEPIFDNLPDSEEYISQLRKQRRFKW